MRYTVCLLFTLLVLLPLGARSTDRPSMRRELLKQLETATEPERKIELYRNLADLALEQPEERVYLQELITLCKATGKQQMLNEAAFDLAYAYIKVDQPDSARQYMVMLSQDKQLLPMLTFLRIKLFDQRIRKNDGEALNDEIDFQRDQPLEDDNICARIHQAYTTGNSLLLSKHEEACQYLKQAYELAQQLPPREGHRLRELIQWTYANACNLAGDRERFMGLIEGLIVRTRGAYEGFYKQTRPYYPVEFYCLPCYASLMTCIDLLPPQTTEEYVRLLTGSMRNLESPYDRFNRDWALSRYYTYKKNYRASVALLDSMTLYIRQIGNTTTLPAIYRTKSQIYTKLGDYKQALFNFKEGIRLTDSLQTSEQDIQLNKLKVQYEVDRLNYDNSKLQNERRKLIITLLVLLLVGIAALCGYLFYTLRREQRIKLKLDRLRAAAEQSEQQKTDFINHICHEIRTPLNAIAGFSHLITDQETDEESQSEFSELISENSDVLATLIGHLMTVSKLNNSDEKLLCTPTDIAAICREEFVKARAQGRKQVAYKCEIPDTEVVISTHGDYLRMVVSSLMNNASKFTKTGEITLRLTATQPPGRVRICVTDTGCGIPEADRERVFERFVKLDRFTTGNGLGLYICRLIMTRLGGTIAIDPDYTQGTCIGLELPAEASGA